MGLVHLRKWEPVHESSSQRLLVMSLAVKLDEKRDSTTVNARDDIIKILHGKSFSYGCVQRQGQNSSRLSNNHPKCV